MNKILIVGTFVCLSVVAVGQAAQSDQSKDKAATPAQVTSPRDAASGQASGKRMHKPVTITAEASTAREASTGKATGKTATDGNNAQIKTVSASDAKGQTRVAAGDVNGDGTADLTAAKNSGHASEKNTAASSANSDVKSPRDAATGQASGKRQHDNVPPAKEAGANPQK